MLSIVEKTARISDSRDHQNRSSWEALQSELPQTQVPPESIDADALEEFTLGLAGDVLGEGLLQAVEERLIRRQDVGPVELESVGAEQHLLRHLAL